MPTAEHIEIRVSERNTEPIVLPSSLKKKRTAPVKVTPGSNVRSVKSTTKEGTKVLRERSVPTRVTKKKKTTKRNPSKAKPSKVSKGSKTSKGPRMSECMTKTMTVDRPNRTKLRSTRRPRAERSPRLEWV